MSILQNSSMKSIYLTLMTTLLSFVVFAQEKSTEVDINVGKEGGNNNWYASPWVWIVGAAVFILLIVALTSGGSRRGDKVTYSKTVERDTDV
jgi:hypothetical protein